jgi:tetratricopeptide (TPR) repeat protein/glycosyltransferase involved in cell wall biosynthesis
MVQIQSFIEQAWRHLRADRPKQAMDCAKKAHAISPNSPDVAHLLGLLASRDGQPQIALPLLQKAIDTGGKTSQRLRHMAEALLDAGYPQQALIPLQDAINEFGESTDLHGLKSAIEIALEQWDAASQSAQKAIALNPSLMAWELNLSFAQMMQGKAEAGFKNATARPKNLTSGSLCPALHFSKPCTVWLKSEQGLGDTLFYLRYVAPLVKQGWQFHLQADRKLIPILESTDLFLSVKEKNNCPNNELSINLGDLPLVAYQTGIKEIPPSLPLKPDNKLVEKYQQELSKLGPAPYIAVTWRGGPKGQKQRAGIGVLEKVFDPGLLGQALANNPATIISLQRLPDPEETQAFYKALGRKPADYSALNNNLAGMLALLSIVDEYITVSNTNLHLREGLAKTSHVFVNRPFQDWRWQAEGQKSIWYPNSHVYRQEKDKTWHPALKQLSQALTKTKLVNTSKKTSSSLLSGSETKLDDSDAHQKHIQLINEGWALVAKNIPEAIARAQAVLQVNPANARALHLLGWAAVQDLKFDIGLSVLAKAVELEPNNGNIWRDYIRAHVLLGQPEKAVSIGNTCLTNPQLWGAGVVHFALGTAYMDMDEDLAALASFERCCELIPEHLDAPNAAGMLRLRMGDGYAGLGFKLNSARSEVRIPEFYPYWICPILKGSITGLNVLIVRSMGFGDELSYLRYLPYLINAGAKVTYWCGFKLVPLLARLPYALTLIPDSEPMPDPANYDLAFIKNELPVAVEHLGAPEIADSLELSLNLQKLEKWRKWLKAQSDGPFLGVSWSAGVSGVVKDGFGYSRLSKKVESKDLAKSLSGINATWVSLTRNITKDELNAFEQALGSPVIDVAGITDDLDDLLCIQALLDENIGVSNTNMHLRACLGLGSKVLVSLSSRDWRWGVEGDRSTWFKDCIVYRESKTNGWRTTLTKLRNDLVEKYGLTEKQPKQLSIKKDNTPVNVKKIVWVTAGEVKKGDDGYYSPLASAQQRVVNVAKILEPKGWSSVYLVESVSELMGGWHDKLPVKGDVVVFSKVITEHAIKLMHDARARGAGVVVDVFNDFESQPARALHQQKMMQAADLVISSPKLQLKWQRLNQPIAFYFNDINDERTSQEIQQITQNWLTVLENPNRKTVGSAAQAIPTNALTHCLADHASCTKRLIWLTDGNLTTVDGHLSSDMASTRYRVLTPAKSLQAYGWQSDIIIEYESKSIGGWGKTIPQPGDLLIISKVFTEHALSLVFDAKKRGVKVLLDMCDNHLNHPTLGGIQKSLIEMADHIVTSTQPLKEALENIGQQADAVISDPVEFKRGSIKFEPSKVLELLWFGHPVNIDTLAEITPNLAILAQTLPLHLKVVTKLPNGQPDLDKIIPAGLSATYIPWSVSATEEAITNCDIVIIPTVQNDFKNAKSPNRLLEPLWAGRMVVAGPLPAYLHFADSAWVGRDIVQGIQWCLANPQEVKARIAQGQADIEKYFTAMAIGHQWQDVLTKATNKPSSIQVNYASGTNQPKNAPDLREVAILTTQHPSLPSIAIRLIEPLGMLEDCSTRIASGFNAQNKLQIDFEALLMRDVIIVQRDFPTEATLPLLKKLKALGKKLVYETDDAFHLIPENHSKAFHRAKAPAIFEFAQLADVLTVSTEALAKEFKPYGNVKVLPNRLSPTLWNDELIDVAKQHRAKHDLKQIRIGLIGGEDHQLDLAQLKQAIKAIITSTPHIEWVAYGDGAIALLKPLVHADKLAEIKTNLDYRSHPARVAEMALDIALVPLLDDSFNQCRSNLKFLEFGFLGVPTVFSNVESYNTTVGDGETGLLVNNSTDSWVKAIQRLIDNPTLREQIGAKAQKEVQTNWMLTSQNNGWQSLLEKLA